MLVLGEMSMWVSCSRSGMSRRKDHQNKALGAWDNGCLGPDSALMDLTAALSRIILWHLIDHLCIHFHLSYSSRQNGRRQDESRPARPLRRRHLRRSQTPAASQTACAQARSCRCESLCGGHEFNAGMLGITGLYHSRMRRSRTTTASMHGCEESWPDEEEHYQPPSLQILPPDYWTTQEEVGSPGKSVL